MTKKDTANEIWDAMKNKYQGNARVKRAQLQRLPGDFNPFDEGIRRSLTENYNFVVCSIEECKNTDELSVDELQSSLLVHEHKLSQKLPDDQVLKTELETSGGG
ncbi:uncharacterized protein LOC143636159 [Bidens hawaiensis]|uniref:uncharacterized protein LOC143636159 n=1 Tax=Bidens hawaiensis TaxID=980011 RepID=UPI00404A7B7C